MSGDILNEEECCPNCGHPTEEDDICPNCGAILKSDDEFSGFSEDEGTLDDEF